MCVCVISVPLTFGQFYHGCSNHKGQGAFETGLWSFACGARSKVSKGTTRRPVGYEAKTQNQNKLMTQPHVSANILLICRKSLQVSGGLRIIPGPTTGLPASAPFPPWHLQWLPSPCRPSPPWAQHPGREAENGLHQLSMVMTGGWFMAIPI